MQKTMIRILETSDEIDLYMKYIKDNNLIKPQICAKMGKPKTKTLQRNKISELNKINKIKIAEERLAERERQIYHREQDLWDQLSQVRNMQTQIAIDIETRYSELDKLENAKKHTKNERPVLQLCRKTIRELSIADTKSHNNEEGCPICFTPSGPRLKMVSFNCGHKFCGDCTVMFLNKSKQNVPFNCPLCRGKIKTVQLTYTKDEGTRIDVAVSKLGEKLLNACQTMTLT
jgi:hypothetical protein